MEFARHTLKETLAVRNLISFHYFEFAKGYVFEGEQHDFWELLYVDKGSVEVRADDRTHQLEQGMIIFHKPGEFHTVEVGQRHKPPNLFVLSFECASPCMARLENVIARLGTNERNLLSLLLQEGFHSFEPPYDNSQTHELVRRDGAPFASEQAMRNYLEMLLIRLIRQRDDADRQAARKPASFQTEKAEQQTAERIIAFMREHLSEQLTLDRLCKELHLGKSRLKEIFQAQAGIGAMDYFKQLKIEEAKTLIREQQYNFTEIAAMLGYGSIHYFSRDFKKATGMPPSDYARTAKARVRVDPV
ncbi:AraC family transcriptional regulator [Paenibacillus arenilitoris]|uniref:Helix-turn-helix transcriptional regulator n=1 Tax=Paenibacillus arenilitoris TaxID=2772299 RepID=A0A927H9K3_9BACL|nr:AraC family transcriptional regulator [Paenibacillus arenilitoris]MBD2871699.1 helix-turn-helix transcriptional regulator [Paenibacillus arenilitoris]